MRERLQTSTAPAAALQPRARALGLRVVSGIVAVPLLVGTAYVGEQSTLGGTLYGAALILACLVAGWEVRSMVRTNGYAPLDTILFGLAAFLPLQAWFLTSRTNGLPLLAPEAGVAICIAVIVSLALLVFRGLRERALIDWALSLSLALYLGGLLQFFAPLRDRPDGAFFTIMLLVISWACDITAYFVGGALGRRKLAPRISPSKSVEGAVAGVVASVLVGGLAAAGTGHPVLLVAGYGLAMGMATVIGDLAESLLKRQTGAKDSGILVPGHGGLLDRMDSLLICAPVAVFYLVVFA